MTKVVKIPGRINTIALLVLSTISACSYADDMYVFDDYYISGNHSKIDLAEYTSSELKPGTYSLDVYTNGHWKGRYDIEIKRDANNKLGACYNGEMLTHFGVAASKLNSSLADKKDGCEMLSKWTIEPKVSDVINKGQMRLDIEVPQTYEDKMFYGYVDPSLWDKGIPAVNIGWNGNVWNTHRSGGNSSDMSTAYFGLNARASIDGWMLKHQGNVSWNSADGSKWNSAQTYLQRPIPAMKSIAAVGQIAGTGEFFDSVTLRGMRLKTDTAMYPDLMGVFSPEVKGVAQTNALVTISQDGKVIHEVTVPPGPFTITDFTPTGYGNDLEVTVKESNGAVNRFTVAYNSGAKLLYPGMFKYEVVAGKPDDTRFQNKPIVYQGTAVYGFNNTLTGYMGVTGFNGDYTYESYLVGAGFNTILGGLSFDVTSSNLKGKGENHRGNMYRGTYSRRIESTATTFSLFGSKFTDENFYGLSDALYFSNKGQESRGRQKSNVGLSINQTLPDGWGSIYANGRLIEYWNRDTREKQYQLTYNNSFGKVYYDVSVQRINRTVGNRDSSDTRIGLNFSVPLNFSTTHTANIVSNTAFDNGHYTGTQLGMNGSLGEYRELTYGVTASNGDNKNVALNAGYKTPFGKVTGSYGQGSEYRQVSLSGNGSVIAHSGGVTFTPESGETLALVEAKGGKGAIIGTTLGSTIDSNGYGVISTVRPYRVNSVSIDPKGSADNVYFNETMKQTVPYEGSVVKVTFDTEVQDNLSFIGKLSNGKPFPFGASVYNTKGVIIGVVGQGGSVFIKNASSPTASVTWAEGKCSFTLPKENDGEVVCQ